MFKESSFNKPESNKSDDEFLMTVTELDSFRNGTKTVAKSEKLDRLNKKIDEVVAGGRVEIFKKLAEAQKEGRSITDLLSEDENELFENYSPDTKLMDLPQELIGKILKPMNKEIRQLIFVQRNTMTLKQAVRVHHNWTKNCVVAYHVSDKEIKEGFLKPDPKAADKAIYFSTDIKRLFNKKSTKYIYAFRLQKNRANTYQYGALDCFGKMDNNSADGIEIEDALSIFDPNDPSYRKRILDSIGAKFAENYHAADDTGDAFLKNRPE